MNYIHEEWLIKPRFSVIIFADDRGFYDRSVEAATGEVISMKDYEGNVVARFEPSAKMSDVDKCVAELL